MSHGSYAPCDEEWLFKKYHKIDGAFRLQRLGAKARLADP